MDLLVTRITEVKATDINKAVGKPAGGGDVHMSDAPVFKDSKEAYTHALGVQKLALEGLRKEIRTSTTSMTSIPKPLKFLRPHYEPLKAYFETMPLSDNKVSYHLISSHLISSHLISSYLISSHLISSHRISSHLISSHLISSHLISSHRID